MSVLMAPSEYPLNHDNSPSQSSMSYMNGYPNGQMFSNQWQNTTRSPNSMGSNGSPSPLNTALPSSMSATTPSPLVNNSNGIPPNPSSAGLPQPLSNLSHSQQSTPPSSTPIRNPFEEDVSRISQGMKPNFSPPMFPSIYDNIRNVKLSMYNTDPTALRFRTPWAYNTFGSEVFRYPVTHDRLNRTQPCRPMIPNPNQIPQQQPPPHNPPQKPNKRQTKKEKERLAKEEKERQQQIQQQQQQQMQHQMMMMQQQQQMMAMNAGHPGPFPPPGMMPSHPMDPNRQPMPPNEFMNDPRRVSPNMPMHMKGRSPCNDGFAVPMGVPSSSKAIRSMCDQKMVTSGDCYMCSKVISDNKKGIRCTAIGQGCFGAYHTDCAGLTPDAYLALLSDNRCEWACSQCISTRKNILFSHAC